MTGNNRLNPKHRGWNSIAAASVLQMLVPKLTQFSSIGIMAQEGWGLTLFLLDQVSALSSPWAGSSVWESSCCYEQGLPFHHVAPNLAVGTLWAITFAQNSCCKQCWGKGEWTQLPRVPLWSVWGHREMTVWWTCKHCSQWGGLFSSAGVAQFGGGCP